jgi:hypothetical protein
MMARNSRKPSDSVGVTVAAGLLLMTVPLAAQVPDVASVDALAKERSALDATLYRNEVAAQKHEETFVKLWDAMRAGDGMEVLKRFPLGSVLLGTPEPVAMAATGVEGLSGVELKGSLRPVAQAEFAVMIDGLKAKGVRIVQSEWHHSKFEPAAGGEPAKSVVSFEIHALLGNERQRIAVKGQLKIRWRSEPGADGLPVPEVIDPTGVQMVARKGDPMFMESLLLDPKVEAPGRFPRTSPVLVQDLNGDGLSELVLAGCNLVYENQGGFRFRKRDFLEKGIRQPMEAGILADCNGDGINDYVGGSAPDGTLLFFAGKADGTFPGEGVRCFGEKLLNLHVLTAGDVDGDGDLDLYAGQWKAPYAEGAMPTPYHDANDGFPDYLLINDGRGGFSDGTAKAGLAAKRNRRTFSASLVRLDDDPHLDLVVVADFSGLDLYRNRGDGTFEDITATHVDERHSFGMSHTFGDFDGDGQSDLYMVGMSSTTARRLDGLGLARSGFEEYTKKRAPMSYGNRLYVIRDGKLSQPAFGATAARTGWSWGCTAADFDIDGDDDLYIANGHLSGGSAKDYCTKFWCHDLYTGSSKPNVVLSQFFQKELGAKLGREFSWNGFEHNTLFLNQAGTGFHNAAFLMGVAQEFDSRAVVSDDLDGDGRMDLAVVEYRTDTMSQRLHVFRNVYESGRNWIGLRLAGKAGAGPVDGAVVRLKAGKRTWVRPLVTGDSFTAQHARVVHFGIGELPSVDALEVVWPGGKRSVIEKPAVNRYHLAVP